ncbi:MAG: hypothetical protein LC776_00920 [Acidobacteria bacterium]|nr:hypothetical protein [Acidobacteriota bacterium]
MVPEPPTSSRASWRQADCLGGCGRIVKQSRDAWVEFGGTRSGSWLAAMGVEARRVLADALPPPADEDLLILGIAHMDCLEQAFRLLRSQRAPLETDLPIMTLEVMEERSGPDVGLPTTKGECPFCQGLNSLLTKEDIYPTWLLKELRRYGARSNYEGRWSTKIVGYTTPACEDCNHRWMSTVENDVKKFMISMFFHTRLLNQYEQDRLALWAAMKAILFDAASDKPVVPRGFGHDLNIHRQPHRGMYVWIAAYTDTNPLVVMPRLIFSSDHNEGTGEDAVIGWCVTFTIVRLVFQVFIPFIDGTLAPLETFNDSVVQLWPRQSPTLDWPPRYQFDSDSVQALAVRIYDDRKPVTTEVTLTEAVRRPLDES